MKRIIAFLFVSLVGFAVLYAGDRPVNFYEWLDKVVFVSGENYDVADDDINVIVSGSDFYIVTPTALAGSVKDKLSDIMGYVLYFSKEADEDSLLESLMDYHSKASTQSGVRVINGYTSGYSDYRYVDGKKYNVQVAFTEDAILVGYPLILTGF